MIQFFTFREQERQIHRQALPFSLNVFLSHLRLRVVRLVAVLQIADHCYQVSQSEKQVEAVLRHLLYLPVVFSAVHHQS